MIKSLKFKRAGSFIIDMSIVQMFATVGKQLYLGIIAYAAQGSGYQFSLNNQLALPILLVLILGIMLLLIGVFMGYQAICYRFLGNSLSRYFLSLKVVHEDDSPLTRSEYLKREYDKITLSVATLGIYPLYAGAQYLAHSNPSWHDRRFKTKVMLID